MIAYRLPNGRLIPLSDYESAIDEAYRQGVATEREACIDDARTVGGVFSTECELLIRRRAEKC